MSSRLFLPALVGMVWFSYSYNILHVYHHFSIIKNKNKYKILPFILLGLALLIYKWRHYLHSNLLYDSESFYSEECCPPRGITPIIAPECTGDDNLPEDDVRKCGKFIKNGTARCMSEGQAFSCK